ncbi:TPA: pentapeptide repeat-containing protein [Aeromonas veronii]
MNQQATTSMLPEVIVGQHRKKNYWESLFDEHFNAANFENLTIKAVPSKMRNGSHFKHYIIDISFSGVKERVKIEGAFFDECDIQGNNGGMKITFKNCKFEKVYFGYSKVNDVNFENCTFINCSFSLTHFYRCSFDAHCVFQNISISGGRTTFRDCIIIPSTLLNNTFKYATEGYCSKYSLDYQEQSYRMNLSIAKLARTLLTSVATAGDDDHYYDAVKSLFTSRITERKAKRIFMARQYELQVNSNNKNLKNLFLRIKSAYYSYTSPLYQLESFFMRLFGFINGWGGSFIRCIVFGFLILATYSIVYFFKSTVEPAEGLMHEALKAIAKSIDITFVAGYTKHSTVGDDLTLQLIHISNMLLGLSWYAVSIPTIVNKTCLARV